MFQKKVLCLTLLVIAASPAMAGQRCDTSVYPLSAPTERFQVNGDGTVTDKDSKLTWMRCSAGQRWEAEACVGEAVRVVWDAAGAVADEANLDSDNAFGDWRIPTLPELAMIAERQCHDPRINLTVFPGTPPDFYWSRSSPSGPGNESLAFALSFGPEGVTRLPKEQGHHVRLVRPPR